MDIKDFDLLASHDLGRSQALGPQSTFVEEHKMLVWQKLEPTGYCPAARQVTKIK